LPVNRRPAAFKVFDDAVALLWVAEKHGLEEVVSKLRTQPYRSGNCRGRLKVKTTVRREANRNCGELFGETRE
jgi:ATP-dependent DNA ligase